MSYTDNDELGIYKNTDHKGPGPRLLGANTLIGDDVYNLQNENLGDIKEIMLDTQKGEISYAVLSLGGFWE